VYNNVSPHDRAAESINGYGDGRVGCTVEFDPAKSRSLKGKSRGRVAARVHSMLPGHCKVQMWLGVKTFPELA